MNYNYYKYNMSNKFDVYSDLNELEMLFGILYTTSAIFIVYMFLFYFFKELFFNKPKTLTIIRGLPGSGKSNLNTDDGYLVSMDDWVQKHGKSIREAHMLTIKSCLNLFSQMATTIYIEGVFAEKWEYEVFKMLASEYNYNFRLVEMPCYSKEEALEFFEESHYSKMDDSERNDWKSWFIDTVYPKWEDEPCNHQMYSYDYNSDEHNSSDDYGEIEDSNLSDGDDEEDTNSSPKSSLKRFRTGSENILNHIRENTRYNLRNTRRIVYCS